MGPWIYLLHAVRMGDVWGARPEPILAFGG